MHLKRSKRKDGRVYLSIVKPYRDGKWVRTKTIQSLGYLDELKKQYKDPIAHFTKLKDELEIEYKRTLQNSSASDKTGKKIKKNSAQRKNLGFCALSVVYHELKVNAFLENRQTKYHLPCSLNSVMKLLVMGRIITPSSRKEIWEKRGSYFDRFDFSLKDFYQAISIIVSYKHQLLKHLHKKMCGKYRQQSDMAFYCVTNCYVEKDRGASHSNKKSAENTKPNPIVSIGLLSDSNSLPITYKIHPCNTCDYRIHMPMLIEARKDYGLGRIIAVADKFMNTPLNIMALLSRDDGYVFAKAIRPSSEEFKEWAIDEHGYTKIGEDTFIKSRVVQCTLKLPEGRAIKSPQGSILPRSMRISEKQICGYSIKHAANARARRQEAVEKAREIISTPSKLDSLLDLTSARYIKKAVRNHAVCGSMEAALALEFDERRLEEEASFDGYFALVTSEVEKNSTETLMQYRDLMRIEKAFTICKADLDTHVTCLTPAQNIESHFLCCFVALLLTHILEIKTGHNFSAAALCEAMRAACGIRTEENWYRFDFRNEVLIALGRAVDIDFSQSNLCAGDIRKIVAGTKKY